MKRLFYLFLLFAPVCTIYGMDPYKDWNEFLKTDESADSYASDYNPYLSTDKNKIQSPVISTEDSVCCTEPHHHQPLAKAKSLFHRFRNPSTGCDGSCGFEFEEYIDPIAHDDLTDSTDSIDYALHARWHNQEAEERNLIGHWFYHVPDIQSLRIKHLWYLRTYKNRSLPRDFNPEAFNYEMHARRKKIIRHYTKNDNSYAARCFAQWALEELEGKRPSFENSTINRKIKIKKMILKSNQVFSHINNNNLQD